MSGHALHIGLNSVLPRPDGWDGKIPSGENDARSMYKLGRDQGFEGPEPILTADAKLSRIEAEICSAAHKLMPGDIFMITFAGHGFQRPDSTSAEPDKYSETWVLYDGEMIDAQLNGMLRMFREGVRVVVVSESCRSGTIILPPPFLRFLGYFRRSARVSSDVDRGIGRKISVPPRVISGIVRANSSLYKSIEARFKDLNESPIRARVLLISACQADQDAYLSDSMNHGMFTEALLGVWKDAVNYLDFHIRVKNRIQQLLGEHRKQDPNYLGIGVGIQGFEDGKPFSV